MERNKIIATIKGAGAFATSLILMLTACTDSLDDIANGKNGNGRILFSTQTAAWNQQPTSRATQPQAHHVSTLSTQVQGATPMVLTAIVGDGISIVKSLGQASDRLTGETGQPASRATLLSGDFSTDETFGIAAYYDRNGSESTLIAPSNVTYENEQWSIGGGPYAWLSNQRATFYAWWPATGDERTTFSPDNKTLADYEVSADIRNQKDVLYAVTTPENPTQVPVDLQFNHALTAVQIIAGEGFPSCTVTSIKLTNLAYKGSFDLTSGSWTTTDDTKDFTLEFDAANGVNVPATGENTILNDGDNTFLVMPQVLSADQGNVKQLVVTTSNGQSYVADIIDEWKPGTTVKYILSQQPADGYIIYASSTPADFEGKGATLSVTSYKLNGSSTIPIRWKVTGYSIDYGKTWMASLDEPWTGTGVEDVTPWIWARGNYQGIDEGDGSTPVTVSLTAGKAAVTRVISQADDINNALKRAPVVSDYDLSRHNTRGEDIPQSTANCYVVSQAGTYQFPAVYGNAIKNGSVNSEAFSPLNFCNYSESTQADGIHISSPYIYEDKDADGETLVPAEDKVKVTWIDDAIKDAITDYRYDAATGMVKFTVSQDKIGQGNAIISLRDADKNIMWSWHIWLTTIMSEADIRVNSSGISYDFAPADLGTVHGGRLNIYDAQAVMLRIQQVDADGQVIPNSATSKVFVSHTGGSEDSRYFDNTYYQFGRKDPLPIYNNGSNPSEGYHRNSGWEAGVYIPMKETIRKPGYFKVANNNDGTVYTWDWCSSHYNNWWNAAYDDKMPLSNAPVVKTVYDPCPVGYHVPDVNAFVGLEYSGNSVSGNTVTLGAANGKDITFALNGYRSTSSGNVSNHGSRSLYWTANPFDGSYAYYMNLETESTTPFEPQKERGNRARGGTIRPVAD